MYQETNRAGQYEPGQEGDKSQAPYIQAPYGSREWDSMQDQGGRQKNYMRTGSVFCRSLKSGCKDEQTGKDRAHYRNHRNSAGICLYNPVDFSERIGGYDEREQKEFKVKSKKGTAGKISCSCGDVHSYGNSVHPVFGRHGTGRSHHSGDSQPCAE